MRNLFKYKTLSVMLIMFFFIGCTDLTEEVYDKVPLADYGKTATEVASLLGPVYTDMRSVQGQWGQGVWGISENSGDMCIIPTSKGGDWWDGGQNKAMRQGTWTPYTARIVDNYNTFMGNITRANRTLYMVQNNQSINATDKAAAVAQLRFARAFWYYVMCDMWGNIPLQKDFTDLTKPTTTPRKDIYAFVLSEIIDIKDVLPASWSGANYGKFTKGAAYTLLAKLYLNAMVWNPTGGAKWQETIDACDVVMGLGYQLETTRRNNFIAQNKACKETILASLFNLTNGNAYGPYTLHYLGAQAVGVLWFAANGVKAMPDYYRAFDAADIRLAQDFIIGPQLNPATGQVFMTPHGRPLIYSIDITMKYGIDAEGWGQVEQEDGVRIGKWEYEKGVTQMQNDMAIFRLADIYLMKAEALVRLGQNNAEATRLVNEIRKRAFTDPAKLKTSVVLDDVYKERRFEFAWEGWCRQDMIRFGTFLNPITGWRGELASYRLIFPIPQTAINVNASLTQNPGY
jgi:hypothetical protein